MVKKQILVYNDEGVDFESLKNTVEFVCSIIDNTVYDVKQIDSEYIINFEWENFTRLLIIPGGADIPYDRKLNGVGCSKIRRFVQNGGSYLGICAGAYFGGAQVKFALGTDLEVVENRELCFFNGITFGPILKPYVYNSNQGSCAAKICFNGFSDFFFIL